MIRSFVNYITKPPPIPPAYIDGFLYVAIAFFGAWAAAFSSDEAAKYIAPAELFWIRSACASLSATFLALKMFRSTGFAEHVSQKKSEAETEFIKRQNP